MENEDRGSGFPAIRLCLVLLLGALIWIRFHGLGFNPVLGRYTPSSPAAAAAAVREIPPELLRLKEENPELARFVDEYPLYYGEEMAFDLTQEAQSDEIPLLLQWDKRWGYQPYGDGLIGDTGCGPTCLSMVALHLTGSPEADPLTICRYAQENGYYAEGAGTSWSLMKDGCREFGLEAEILPLVQGEIEDALDRGEPVILALGPGDFTRKGHFIVLTGYDREGFTVHDPNSPLRSGRHWTYDTLESQILNIWAYTKSEES